MRIYNENIKTVIQYLEKITRCGYSRFDVYKDWIDLMLFAFQGNKEIEYLAITNKYSSEVNTNFAEAAGKLTANMLRSNCELLGEIYMQWEVNSQCYGQYFTPAHIASFMASLHEPKAGVISDCCAGSGIFLIEQCKLMNNENLNQSVFIAQDIDLTCTKICALNMLFFNLNSYVINGDTLQKGDERYVWQTQRTHHGGIIRELNTEQIEEIKSKIETENFEIAQNNTNISQNKWVLF